MDYTMVSGPAVDLNGMAANKDNGVGSNGDVAISSNVGELEGATEETTCDECGCRRGATMRWELEASSRVAVSC